MLRLVVTLVAVFYLIQSGTAQSYSETARLFSRVGLGGSARVVATGGAFTALGGDFSSATANPAGIGMFNRFEISISPGYGLYHTDSKYINNSSSADKSKLILPALGIVFHKSTGNETGLITSNFSITMNRLADFNQKYHYSGKNTETSMVDYMIDQAFGYLETDLESSGSMGNSLAGLGYRNYLIGPWSLIDPGYPEDEYFSDVITQPIQEETIELSGGVNQWNLTYGANIDDKIFLGAGIGIPTLTYRSVKTYSEAFPDDDFLTNFTLNETLDIHGGGVNLNVGAIFRPIDFVQIGLRYTSPSYLRLSESYVGKMSSLWNDFDYFGDGSEILSDVSSDTDIITSNYSLRIPGKLSGGIALLSKIGFLSLDAEVIDPSKAKYNSKTEGVSFDTDNSEIALDYMPAINIRLGGEVKINMFRVRGGFASQSNSKLEGEIDTAVTYSGGVGYRSKTYYIDFAIANTTRASDYKPYGGISRTANFDHRYLTGMFTIGFLY